MHEVDLYTSKYGNRLSDLCEMRGVLDSKDVS